MLSVFYDVALYHIILKATTARAGWTGHVVHDGLVWDNTPGVSLTN